MIKSRNNEGDQHLLKFEIYFSCEPTAPTSLAKQPTSAAPSVVHSNQYSSLSASGLIKIDYEEAGMTFKINVNDTQRDQYRTDKCKLGTREKTGCFVRVQGDKSGMNEKAIHGSVLPKIKVIIIFFIVYSCVKLRCVSH